MQKYKAWEYLAGATVICAMLWWGYSSWIDKPAKVKQRTERIHAEESRRFKDWAYVAKEKEIRPGETVKLVIVPHPWGGEFLDTKCFVYANHEYKQASMVCPDANKDYISDKE